MRAVLFFLLACIAVNIVTADTLPDVSDFFDTITGAEYVRCYDGDTCTVNIKKFPDIIGQGISIRLWGIDTPEMKGKCSKEKNLAIEARNFLVSRFENARTIELRKPRRDKYFRILCEVWINGRNINKLMVEQGFAVEYDGGTKVKDWCK
jgi:endonuclease YncB( thermonuclease family)